MIIKSRGGMRYGQYGEDVFSSILQAVPFVAKFLNPQQAAPPPPPPPPAAKWPMYLGIGLGITAVFGGLAYVVSKR